MATIDPDDPRTASVQIADDFRSKIERGELTGRLPSGRETASAWGVALMTAQAALQKLRDEGLVYSTGRGYFVGQTPGGEDDTDQRLRELVTEVRELRSRVEALESGR